MPLLFEQATQAQFLKPLIISLAFGLIFGTLIVLFLLPAFLVSIENMAMQMARIHSRFPKTFVASRLAQLITAGVSRVNTSTSRFVMAPKNKQNGKMSQGSEP